MTAIGNLGRDPETRYLPSGAAICSFSVAMNSRWTDKATGEKKERTEWLNCQAFDRLAEVCDTYLKKGALVYVEGALETRTWEKDGQKKSKTECRISNMTMLAGTGMREGGAQEHEPADTKPQKVADAASYAKASGGSVRAPTADKGAAKAAKPSGSGFDDFEDDIPF